MKLKTNKYQDIFSTKKKHKFVKEDNSDCETLA